jgi:uncharacterized integral membrane protein
MESPEQPQMTSERRTSGPNYTRFIVPAVAAVFVLILILQNRVDHWRFHFFFWWFSLRAWLMVVFLLALGFLIGMAISAFLRRRKRQQLKRRGGGA